MSKSYTIDVPNAVMTYIYFMLFSAIFTLFFTIFKIVTPTKLITERENPNSKEDKPKEKVNLEPLPKAEKLTETDFVTTKVTAQNPEEVKSKKPLWKVKGRVIKKDKPKGGSKGKK